MDIWLILKTLLLFSSQFISGFSICYVWFNGRRNPVSRYFIWIHILLLIWIGSELLCNLFADCRSKWFFAQLEYGAICFLGFCWLVFCLHYVKSNLITRRNLLLLVIPPVLNYGTIFSNRWHHLFFDVKLHRFEVLFYPFILTMILYGIVGVVLLMVFAVKQPAYRRQTWWIVVAAIAPLCNGFMSAIGTITYDGVKFNLWIFNISSLLFLIGISRYRLDIVPVALRNIVAQMKEIIIVIDNDDRIVDYNQAFAEVLHKFGTVKPGELIHAVLETLQQQHKITLINKNNLTDSNSQSPFEIYLKPAKRWFSVNIQPFAAHNTVLGEIITLYDITEYKQLVAELNQKNTELTLLNEQLQEQAAAIEELTTVKERNRVVQDIHDTLGQTMTLLLTTLQLCKLKWREDPATAEVKLDQAMEFADKAVRQTRQALYGLVPAQHNETQDLSGILPKLAEEFAASGMEIEWGYCGREYPVNGRAAQVIYHLCQEALTNTLRHAQTKHLMIKLNFTATHLLLEIRDDGLGCADFKAGIGLHGMERRIKSLGGQISIVSHPNAGFMILAEIPKMQLL